MKLSNEKFVVKCFDVFYMEPERKVAAVVMEKMPFDVQTYLNKKSPRGELPWSQRFKVLVIIFCAYHHHVV